MCVCATRLWIFSFFTILLKLENYAIQYDLLTFLLIFWEKLWNNSELHFCVFSMNSDETGWCLPAPSFCLLYPGSHDQRLNLFFYELFLEISQYFEIFNWQTVSLLTKVVLEKKNLIQFTNGSSVMFHERSGFSSCFKKEAECPGKPDLFNLSIYLYFLLQPTKTKK